MAILVFGSANIDISVNVEGLPRLGETKHGSDYRIGLGGKGLNQAVAATRLSKSPVAFVGAIGTDHYRITRGGGVGEYGDGDVRYSS